MDADTESILSLAHSWVETSRLPSSKCKHIAWQPHARPNILMLSISDFRVIKLITSQGAFKSPPQNANIAHSDFICDQTHKILTPWCRNDSPLGECVHDIGKYGEPHCSGFKDQGRVPRPPRTTTSVLEKVAWPWQGGQVWRQGKPRVTG